jgi:hypothetical protein
MFKKLAIAGALLVALFVAAPAAADSVPRYTTQSGTTKDSQGVTIVNPDGTLAPLSGGAQPSVTLLAAASSATGSAQDVTAGTWFWSAEGTWGGTTAALQWRRLSTTAWIAIDSASLTADGAYSSVELAAGQVRVTITGGSGVSLASTIQRQR